MTSKVSKEENQQIDEKNQKNEEQQQPQEDDQKPKPVVQDPPEIRFKNYLEETGISEAFQIILAEILQKQIKKQFICHYAAERLRQIGQELENIKLSQQQGIKGNDNIEQNKILVNKSPKGQSRKMKTENQQQQQQQQQQKGQTENLQKKPVEKAK